MLAPSLRVCSLLVPSMLVLHQSNRVSAIIRTLFSYRHISIFVFFTCLCVPCYFYACAKSTALREGVKMLYKTMQSDNSCILLSLTIQEVSAKSGSQLTCNGSSVSLRSASSQGRIKGGNCPGPSAPRGPRWWHLFVLNKTFSWKIVVIQTRYKNANSIFRCCVWYN